MAKKSEREREIESRLRWILGVEADDRELLYRNQWAAPHVFIGVGGTGTHAVTRIAERLTSMVRAEDGGEGTLPGCLQFLAIDTDCSEFTPLVRKAGVDVVDLTVSNPKVVWAANEKVFRNLGFERATPVELGAGGRRKHGRFAFVAHSPTVKSYLDQALANAIGYPGLADDRDPRIHVFFSLVGGTGCGIFLDLAFLIRAETAALRHVEVNAYVVFPDNIVAPIPQSKMASAAGAFKELEYFMQFDRGEPKFTGWGEGPRSGEEITYWKGGAVKGLVRRPFDICYLFGSVGDGEGAVEDPDDFTGVLAEAAIRNAFSEAGIWNRRRVVDLTEHFDTHWLRKYASFSAIGYSRLFLPSAELGAYLTLDLAEGVCDFLLDGPRRWDRQSPEAKALLESYVQKLTTGLSVDEVVVATKRAVLDAAKGLSELEQLWARNLKARIRQACDALPTLFDTIWNESENTRRRAIQARLGVLREIIDVHTNDLDVGLHDDIAFFADLKARMTLHEARCAAKAKAERENLERDLAKLPAVKRFLSRRGAMAFITSSANFNALKAVYQVVISRLHDYMLARANAELAAELLKELSRQIELICRTRDHVANDLKARYAARKEHFQQALSRMRHGKAADDSKTFCPVDLTSITEQAENMLRPLRLKFGGMLNNAQRTGRIDLTDLYESDPDKVARLRLEILHMLLPEINVEQLWQRLVADAEQWNRIMAKARNDVLLAGSPLVQFGSVPPAGVLGCYANFDADERGRITRPPLDRHSREVRPLVPQSGCREVTRFFHGIRLCDLAIAREMGNQYRAYMEELRRVPGGFHPDQDQVNLFETLLNWPPPDEGLREQTEDRTLVLWALGLCFSEVLPPDEEERKALRQANLIAERKVKGRKNYLFRIGNFYYIQPFYQAPVANAPACQLLAHGRTAAYDAFRKHPEARDEMEKWYKHADQTWMEHYRLAELQEAIGKYLEGLTTGGKSGSDLIVQEREVVRAFLDDPFPEID